MTALAIILGAATGLGIWAIASAAWPVKPSLASAVAALETANAPVAPVRGTLVATPLRRLGLPPKTTLVDLSATGITPEAFLATQTFSTLTGIAAPMAMCGLLATTGIGVGVVTSVWTATLGGVIGYLLPRIQLAQQAAATRAAFRRALTLYLDLVVIALSGGAGIDQALTDAADIGGGDAFAAIRRGVATAHLTRTSVWDRLADLGERIGVPEYQQLAATVGLAGDEGARIRTSLTARAKTLRSAQLAAAEAHAAASTERMSLPIVTLFAAFLLLIGYPAVSAVLTGL